MKNYSNNKMQKKKKGKRKKLHYFTSYLRTDIQMFYCTVMKCKWLMRRLAFLTSAPSMLDLFGGSIFSFDFSASESDWLPESEPLPESLLPDWLLLLEELELEPEPEPDAEPDPEPDSSSELLNGGRKDRVREREREVVTLVLL